MEDRWILIILLLVLLAIPLQVTAYSNTNIGGHPTINTFAVQYFEHTILPNDPFLAHASIRGRQSWGYAWDETDGSETIGPRHTIYVHRNKLLHQWIEDGGYSADEPEYTMALIHFYDPTDPERAYLTDLRFLQQFAQLWDEDFINPQRSAVDWAFDRDLAGYAAYYTQDYSWNDALRYYTAALASPSRTNDQYGNAWRAVGETMHLVSDMTVPAHVRNDGHAWSDPYEDSVGSKEIYAYAGGQPLSIDYNKGSLRDLMVEIAKTVNRNYFSADTMPYERGGVRQYSYSAPTLEGLSKDSQGYYYSPVSGALAREVYCPVNGGVYLYSIDRKVLDDQRSVLIPTAVRASAEVLDRFLPRFEATLTVKKYLPDDSSDDQYLVHTTLQHMMTDAWKDTPDGLVVRNGASLMETTPDGRQHEIPVSLTPNWILPPKDPTFNDWSDIFKFQPGSRVYMEYDLGGYVIRSNEVYIPLPTPTTTVPGTTKEKTTVPTPPGTGQTTAWGCVNTASCTPDHPEQCCPGTTFEPCTGCEKCCYWSDATNPVTGQKPMGFVIDAFCSCATGESALSK